METSPRFVYLLHSKQDPDQFYIGLTTDPRHRLAGQDDDEPGDTTRHRPWRLIVTMEFTEPLRAIAFERYLKSGSGREFSKRHFR